MVVNLVAAQPDFLNLHGQALLDLAEVAAGAGDDATAGEARRSAHDLFERKGNLVGMRRSAGERITASNL